MKIMMVGSSWAVGAWKKSSQPYCDELDSPGVPELLAEHYEIANFSQRDSFNYGGEEQAKLNHYENYDLILACQNDVYRDLAYCQAQNATWADIKKFNETDPVSSKAFIRDQVDDLEKLRQWLLNRFYSVMASYGKPVMVYAGPTLVDQKLAEQHGLIVVQPDWCKLLVPDYTSSYVESSFYLGWASELLIDLFPKNKSIIQNQCLELLEQVNVRRVLYESYPEYFAYHHPTVNGNRPMANLLIQHLKEIS